MDIYKQIEKYNQIYKMLKNYRIKKEGLCNDNGTS